MQKFQANSVTILTLHRSDDSRVFARQARTLAQVTGCVRLITPRGQPGYLGGVEVEVVPAPGSRAENFLWTPWRLLRAALRRPTRFFFLHDAPLLYLVPLLWALGFDVVYDVHEDYANMLRHRDWIPPPLRAPAGVLARYYEKTCARLARAVVTATAPLLEGFPHGEKVVLHNLPTLDLIENGARQTTPCSQREFDVVHLGSLSDRRLDFFARVVESVVVMRPGLRVLVIGLLPHQVPRLRNRFPEGLLTIVERAPHAEVPGLLGRCRIGVDIHPWLLPHLALAVPVKVFEYMACGCAVVTSHLPEFERLLEPEDLARITVVHGDDPSAYARAVVGLLQRHADLDETGRALQRRVAERYTWDRERERLVRLFRRLSETPESRRGRWVRRLLAGGR